MRRGRSLGRTLLWLFVSLFWLWGCRGKETEVVVAAAASLRNVMPELVTAYTASRPGVRVVVTYGASGDLRRQVEAGAPTDVVVFAGAKPVDDLVGKGLCIGDTRRVIAKNRLVLIGPKGGKKVTFETIDSLLAGERLAIGDPASVPAGQYAKQALEKLGKWDAMKERLVLGSDVAAVLAYAKRGEVPAAIVYGTDTRGMDDVVVMDEAKGEWAPEAPVVAAVVKGSKREEAGRFFVEFLESKGGQKLLRSWGFDEP